MGLNAPPGEQDRYTADLEARLRLASSTQAANSASRSTVPNAGTGGGSGLSSSLQAALKDATENYNRIMGGGGSSGGGGSADSGAMTAYQAAQLDLDRQRLQQQNQQFNVGQQNDLYQFGAQLGNNQSQFSQNYLLNYLTTMEELGGSDVDWARIDLDTRRQGLAEMLGAGELTQGFQKLDLAEQDMDIKRMLGMGDYQLGQAQVYSTLQRLGIDSRAADLDYQVQMARMGVDQQIAQARLMEAQGAASAAQAQAQADMLRAQAALQAVQVELQLGNGNLELGRQKAADAMKLGMEDIAVRREDMGLRERLGSLDANVRMNIASMQAGTDMARLFQEGQFQKADLIAQLHGKPRDWLKAAEVQQAFAPGGEAASFGAPTGPIEMMDLNTFAQQNNLNLNPWGTPTAGGGNPWAQMVQQYMSGAGQMNPYAFSGQGNQQAQYWAGAPGGYQQAGAQGEPDVPQGPPPVRTDPGPYNPNGSLNYNAVGLGTFGDANAIENYRAQALAENTGRWQSQVQRGLWTQTDYDRALAQRNQQIDAEIAARPDLQAAGLPIMDGAGGKVVDGTGKSDVTGANGQRLRIYQLPNGQKYLQPIKQSGGYIMDAAGVIRADDRPLDAQGRPVDANTFGGLPIQETYRAPDGSMYAVPQGYGPQGSGDVRVGGPASYRVQDPKTGQWVSESQLSGQPVINANGTVTMPSGQTLSAQGQPVVPTAQAGSVAPATASTPGSFTMPGAAPQPGGSAIPSAGGLPSYGSLPPVGDFYASLFSTNPFTTSGASGGSTGTGSSSNYMQMYQQLLGQIGQTGSATTSTSRPANEYDQLADALLAQMLGGQIPMQQGTNGQYQMYTPTVTTPTVPGGAQSPAVPTTPNSAYGYGTPTQIQQGNTTGNPNWMPAWTPGSAYYPQSSGAVSVTPDNYEQVKAYEDLKYLLTKGPMDFINFPGQGGAQTQSKHVKVPTSGSPNNQSWAPSTAPNQASGQVTSPTLQNAQNTMQSTYSGYVNQYGSQLPEASTYQYPQWTNPNYAEPTQATAQYMQYQGDSGQTAWGQPIPQYATGTSYVPETGPAIVHQGEAIVPAAQNPANPASSLATSLTASQLRAIQSGQANPSAYYTMIDKSALHGVTKSGWRWDTVQNRWVEPGGALSALPSQGTVTMPAVNQVTRAPSPTDMNSMAVPQPAYSQAQQTGQPPHAAPTTPSTGSYTPQPTTTAVTMPTPVAPVAPVTPTAPAAPVAPSVTPIQAQAQDAITRVFGKYVSPSQVPLRIWNRMLPTTKEVLRGAWQAMGIQVDDAEHNIWQAGNTEGVAFQGQGYGSIGR